MEPKQHQKIAFQLVARALEDYDFPGALADMEHEGLSLSANDVLPILSSVEATAMVIKEEGGGS